MKWRDHLTDLAEFADEFQRDEADVSRYLQRGNCNKAATGISDLQFSIGQAEAAWAGAKAAHSFDPDSREAIDGRDAIKSMRATMKALNAKFPTKCVKAI